MSMTFCRVRQRKKPHRNHIKRNHCPPYSGENLRMDWKKSLSCLNIATADFTRYAYCKIHRQHINNTMESKQQGQPTRPSSCRRKQQKEISMHIWTHRLLCWIRIIEIERCLQSGYKQNNIQIYFKILEQFQFLKQNVNKIHKL